MLKSGLILGVVALVLMAVTSLLSGLCGPCLALFIGLGAGYLAGVFDKPFESGASAKSGALSGAISGIGALAGQLVGSVGTLLIVGPEQAARLLRQFGLPMDTSSGTAGYYLGGLGTGCCFGLVDLVLMAGLGALGGLLWYQVSGKKTITPPMP